MEMIEQLQNLGFSQYEAQAYIALLRENPVNGYELAKHSGIPRPNIYPVLQKLEERGAVLRVDTPEGARYAPVEPEELLGKLEQRFHSSLDSLSDGLREVCRGPEVEYIINLHGLPALIDHARALLDGTRQHLLVSIWPEEAAELAGALEQARERGVQITTLCLRGCPQPCPACRGVVFRYPIAPSEGGRWLVVVTDNHEVLAGEITPSGDAAAVRTRQPLLVNLSEGYIQNSIALASILNQLGERVESLLDPPVLAALNSLHAHRPGESWLDMMRRMVRQGHAPIGFEPPAK